MITEVNVAAMTAVMTSCVPTLAAVTRSWPFSRFWKMDSRTTTALSTSMPVASIRPIMESTFKVLPIRNRKPTVAMIENGMAKPMARVAPSLRRKRNRTITARKAPMVPESSSPVSDLVISLPASNQTRT